MEVGQRTGDVRAGGLALAAKGDERAAALLQQHGAGHAWHHRRLCGLARQRDEAIDHMAEDMAAGRSLAASDVSHLTHADLINIKAHGDDYIRELISQREQEEYRRHLGNERERER